MKVRTNILIEKEVLRQAKELGLNVSKTVEILLRNYIEQIKRIQQADLKEASKTQDEEDPPSDWCGRRDLNPGPQRGRLTS